MQQGLIFLHGDCTKSNRIIDFYHPGCVLICADGASEYAKKYNLIPHAVVGDMDSISDVTLSWLKHHNVAIDQHPKEKDQTDSELAIHKALDLGCDEIIIFGLLGRRIDHMAANIMFLCTIAKTINLTIVEGDQYISFTRSTHTIQGQKGDEVSLVPLQADCREVSTSGLQYKLTKAPLPFGSTQGVSNVMKSTTASVSLSKGVLMVIHRRGSALS